jgi:hypothetical protein
MIIPSFRGFTGFKLIYDYYMSAENAKELGFVCIIQIKKILF